MTGIYEHAEQRLITVNHNGGGCRPRLLIVHIMEGTLAGTDSWFRNPESQVSAHFGVGKAGQVYQWVDCNDTAWHAAEANNYAIGVEHEGFAGNPLTPEQVKATAGIFAWAVREYPAIDPWLNRRPFAGTGLSWHGLGAARWGGHLGCPGSAAVHQLLAILEASRS